MTEDSKQRVTSRIDGKLNGLSLIPFDQRCIFKVNDPLRKVNEESYRPKAIGIGPYHHHKYYPNASTIQAMEEYKLCYLQNLLEKKRETSVERYVVAMQELEEKARNCYAEPIDDLNSDEFVEMMLLDGCFIVEFLRKYILEDLEQKSDLFLTGHISTDITRDLLLFENQLPLFVLLRILDMTRTSSTPADNIIDLSKELLSTIGNKNMVEASLKSLEVLRERPVDRFGHLLALVHYCWCFPFASKELLKSQENNNNSNFIKCTIKVELAPRVSHYCCFPFANAHEDDASSKREFIKSTSELQEAGIKFNKFSGTTLFDIKFRKGRMEIPPLRVQEDTEPILRNLVAYEQYSRVVDKNTSLII